MERRFGPVDLSARLANRRHEVRKAAIDVLLVLGVNVEQGTRYGFVSEAWKLIRKGIRLEARKRLHVGEEDFANIVALDQLQVSHRPFITDPSIVVIVGTREHLVGARREAGGADRDAKKPQRHNEQGSGRPLQETRHILDGSQKERREAQGQPPEAGGKIRRIG